MRVQLRLFASYREIVGEGRLAWTAVDGVRLRELVDAVVTRYPRLAGHRGSMLLAVNHSLASPDLELREGDEVAIMPPVSGGIP